MDRLPAIRVSDSDDGFQSQSKQRTNVVGSTSSTTRAICLAVFLLIAIILIGCMTKRSLSHRAATEMGVMQPVKRPRLFEANIAHGRQVGGVTWGGIMLSALPWIMTMCISSSAIGKVLSKHPGNFQMSESTLSPPACGSDIPGPLCSGFTFTKPKPAEAKPKPWFQSQAKPEHH
ncbi:hypothetical protein B0H14DRAFT_2556569 [Mycena olivaceomarginata]|nr:hypothetical protein B0H14DRAFT_2556569 [Mycena olivaceomarginata]